MYDFLLKVVETKLTTSKATESFNGGKGTMLEVRVDVKNISGTDVNLKLLVQFSDDNVNFEDGSSKEYKAVKFNDKFYFHKPKQYHRFSLVLSGTSPSVDIELNQR
jgi:hypothetical protein